MLGFTQLLITLYLLHHGMVMAHPLSPGEALAKRGLGGAPPAYARHRVLTKRMEVLGSKGTASVLDSASQTSGAASHTADGFTKLEDSGTPGHTVVTPEPPTGPAFDDQQLPPHQNLRPDDNVVTVDPPTNTASHDQNVPPHNNLDGIETPYQVTLKGGLLQAEIIGQAFDEVRNTLQQINEENKTIENTLHEQIPSNSNPPVEPGQSPTGEPGGGNPHDERVPTMGNDARGGGKGSKDQPSGEDQTNAAGDENVEPSGEPTGDASDSRQEPPQASGDGQTHGQSDRDFQQENPGREPSHLEIPEEAEEELRKARQKAKDEAIRKRAQEKAERMRKQQQEQNFKPPSKPVQSTTGEPGVEDPQNGRGPTTDDNPTGDGSSSNDQPSGGSEGSASGPLKTEQQDSRAQNNQNNSDNEDLLPSSEFVKGILKKQQEEKKKAEELKRQQAQKLKELEEQRRRENPLDRPEQSTMGNPSAGNTQGKGDPNVDDPTSGTGSGSNSQPSGGGESSRQNTSQQGSSTQNNQNNSGNRNQPESDAQRKTREDQERKSRQQAEEENKKREEARLARERREAEIRREKEERKLKEEAERKRQQEQEEAERRQQQETEQAERRRQQEGNGNQNGNQHTEIPHEESARDGNPTASTEPHATNHVEGDSGKVPPTTKENEIDAEAGNKLREANQKHGEQKPKGFFLSALHKLVEKFKMMCNRLMNFLCRRKKSSLNPSDKMNNVLFKDEPYNPSNESADIKAAREAEQGKLRPKEANANERDPLYVIPDREAKPN
ncbi:hypothetical protein PtA15_3A120 [Puccinia triticina]|uniref:Uncharacterized protein n=1 Tax=Puccinia triticina TaxID=208348 RepID=A0ABY7CC07_9BASI|nr:uncharacterized protein PtA15_3A120 [Puccinia triticina]WAQ82756.1 hypothetical protein PtA15_3A120 [Puccinia triticina]